MRRARRRQMDMAVSLATALPLAGSEELVTSFGEIARLYFRATFPYQVSASLVSHLDAAAPLRPATSAPRPWPGAWRRARPLYGPRPDLGSSVPEQYSPLDCNPRLSKATKRAFQRIERAEKFAEGMKGWR